jgi:hypothetical protein
VVADYFGECAQRSLGVVLLVVAADGTTHVSNSLEDQRGQLKRGSERL